MSETARRSRLRTAWLLLACVLLGPAAVVADDAPLAQGAGRSASKSSRAVDPAMTVKVLAALKSMADGSQSDLERIAKGIAKLGPSALPSLDELAESFAGARHQEVIARATAHIKKVPLQRHLLDVAAGGKKLVLRTNALHLLGAVGGMPALDPVLRLGREDWDVRRETWRTVAAILARHSDTGSYHQITVMLRELPLECRCRLLSAVADAGTPQGMKLLADLVGADPRVDPVIVTGLGRMPRLKESPAVLARLRELLETDRMILKRDIVQVLGNVKDIPSVPILIELLADSSRSVRENAYWALKNISGLSFPKDQDRWRYWHLQESMWWKDEAERHFAMLRTGNPAQMFVAIQALGQRSLHREKALSHLSGLVDHESESIRLAVASAQATLAGQPGVASGFRFGDRSTRTAGGWKPAKRAPAAEPKPGLIASNRMVILAGFLALLVLLLRLSGHLSFDSIRRLLPR